MVPNTLSIITTRRDGSLEKRLQHTEGSSRWVSCGISRPVVWLGRCVCDAEMLADTDRCARSWNNNREWICWHHVIHERARFRDASGTTLKDGHFTGFSENFLENRENCDTKSIRRSNNDWKREVSNVGMISQFVFLPWKEIYIFILKWKNGYYKTYVCSMIDTEHDFIAFQKTVRFLRWWIRCRRKFVLNIFASRRVYNRNLYFGYARYIERTSCAALLRIIKNSCGNKYLPQCSCNKIINFIPREF